jgi:hypothetical protein
MSPQKSVGTSPRLMWVSLALALVTTAPLVVLEVLRLGLPLQIPGDEDLTFTQAITFLLSLLTGPAAIITGHITLGQSKREHTPQAWVMCVLVLGYVVFVAVLVALLNEIANIAATQAVFEM